MRERKERKKKKSHQHRRTLSFFHTVKVHMTSSFIHFDEAVINQVVGEREQTESIWSVHKLNFVLISLPTLFFWCGAIEKRRLLLFYVLYFRHVMKFQGNCFFLFPFCIFIIQFLSRRCMDCIFDPCVCACKCPLKISNRIWCCWDCVSAAVAVWTGDVPAAKQKTSLKAATQQNRCERFDGRLLFSICSLSLW